MSPAQPVRVLVVDDNVDMAETLALLLGFWGHESCIVHDGRRALEKAAGFRPDVVLLDIGLPGMDGYRVAARLRQQPGMDRAILIAVTGYGQDEDYRHSQEAGIAHHLVKPVDLTLLRDLLERCTSPAHSA